MWIGELPTLEVYRMPLFKKSKVTGGADGGMGMGQGLKG